MKNDSDIDKDQLIEELRAAIAARDEFIAIVAHELRNPITPIVAQVQLLYSRARREGVSDSLLKNMENLQLAVDHYLRRATTLLEISTLNAGQLKLEQSTFDLCELVRDCARNHAPIALHAGSEIVVDVPENAFGRWDRIALEQVLDNLVSNAVRYGDGKPILISLRASASEVEVRVADRGIGIAPEDRVRIFERFERAVGNHTRGGFGIGLWLANKLVNAHAGELRVESELGAGSEFIVRLPRESPTVG